MIEELEPIHIGKAIEYFGKGIDRFYVIIDNRKDNDKLFEIAHKNNYLVASTVYHGVLEVFRF